MMKRLIISVFMLILISSIVNADLSTAGIEEGQEIVIGDTVSMDFTSDVPLSRIGVSIASDALRAEDISYMTLFFLLSIPESDGIMDYGYSWDTSGLPEGVYTLTITSLEHGADDYMRSEINVILTDEPGDSEHLRAIRNTAPIVYPDSMTYVYLYVAPLGDFTGLILREFIDPGLIFAVTGERPDAIVGELGERREAKWILRDPERVEPQIISYAFHIYDDVEVGTTYPLEGNVLVRTEGGADVVVPIGGVSSIVVAEPVLDCPITDSDLLMQIDRWASGEITNLLMLQIIERWRICQEGE